MKTQNLLPGLGLPEITAETTAEIAATGPGPLQPGPDLICGSKPVLEQNLTDNPTRPPEAAAGAEPDAGAEPKAESDAEPEANPEAGTGADGWPPLADMLHSLFVFEPTTPEPAPITVLGLPCGGARGPAALAPEHLTLLEQAHVLCAGKTLLADFASCTARHLPLTAPLEPVLTRVSQMHAAGERVLVLADGDPLFFGIGGTLVRQLGEAAVRLIPAVSSLQQACARLALPWHTVINLSLHGRDDLGPLNVAASKDAPLCILTDARMTPDVLARHLLDRGVDWFTAHIFERMGAQDEARHSLSLAETACRSFGPACTMILTPREAPRRPCLGLDAHQLAVENGLITKKPVRAAALALLRIGPRHVVWDIGSGSGAVALEAAALAHEGRVIAVERSAGRAMSIQENRRRYGAAIVEVCLGQAPECLPSLPDPQRVFVGGGLSGEDAEDILGHICLRLPPGGRIAAACVLLDSLYASRRFFEGLGWPVEILQVQAAEARDLGSDVHLAALNPVFLVAAEKPGA